MSRRPKRTRTAAMPRCPSCDGAMVRQTRPRLIVYKGRSRTIDQPGLWCTVCEEGVITGAEEAAADRVLAEMKAEAKNVLPPAKVKRIRKKLRLSPSEAGRLLGGGEFAFRRYEGGTEQVSRPLANLLRILDRHPAYIRVLFEAKGLAYPVPARTSRSTRRQRRA